MGRFLTVGAGAFIVDMGLFNLLVFGPMPLLAHKPVTAKIIAAVVATVVSWLGNRSWTFAHRRSDRPWSELLRYGAVNALALLIPPAVLYVTLYGVGAEGLIAANVASVIGIAVGTVVRYLGYKLWAFKSKPVPQVVELDPAAAATR